MLDKFRRSLFKVMRAVSRSNEMKSLNKAIDSGTVDEGLRALAMQATIILLYEDDEKTYHDAAWKAAQTIDLENMNKRRDIVLSYHEELNRLSVKDQLKHKRFWRLFRNIVAIVVVVFIVISAALLIKGMVWGVLI